MTRASLSTIVDIEPLLFIGEEQEEERHEPVIEIHLDSPKRSRPPVRISASASTIWIDVPLLIAALLNIYSGYFRYQDHRGNESSIGITLMVSGAVELMHVFFRDRSVPLEYVTGSRNFSVLVMLVGLLNPLAAVCGVITFAFASRQAARMASDPPRLETSTGDESSDPTKRLVSVLSASIGDDFEGGDEYYREGPWKPFGGILGCQMHSGARRTTNDAYNEP